MRDEMSKWPWLLPINSRRLLFYERRILKDADLILSVSAPLVEDFKQIGGGIDKVIEITNGYDYEEVHDVSFQPVYTMAFIGHFYNSITPDKWFGAFSELVAEGALPSDSRILIIGNTSPLAVPENIRQNVFQIRQVDHDEAIRKSLETDTLVVVHPKGRKGVYTGKLFDYLATNKPILAICDPDDLIADLLKETRAGFTADETDNEQVKRMLLRCYSIWKNKEVLPRDWDKIRQYSRKNQVGRLLEYLAGQEALLPYITPSFRRRLHAAEKMLTEDGTMFTGLFEANPYSHEAVRQYRKMLNVAAAGDIELLCRRAQWWWKK